MEVPIKRLMISAFAAIALLAAATAMLQSHSPATNRASVTAGMMSLQELHAAADVNKLPIGEFEDQSLVYSTTTKH
jgi:hypothetical protein